MVLALLAAAKGSIYGSIDPDWFWHIRVGTQLLEQGIGPLVDQISYASMREPWTPYSWLAELLLKWIWDIGGLPGTVLVQALVMGAFVYVIALACREGARSSRDATDSTVVSRPGPAGIVVSATIFTFLVLPFLSLRPVTMALVALGLSSWLLLRDRRRLEKTRSIWWLVPLTILAANLHFYAMFAPIFCGALLIGAIAERRNITDRPEANRRIKRYALLTALCGAACFATPMPLSTFKAVMHYAFSDQMVSSKLIAEMKPLWDGSTGIVNALLLVIALAFIVRRRALFRIGEWIWLAICLVLALRLGRCVVLLALIAGPMLATAFQWQGIILERRGFRSVLAVLVAALMLRITLSIPTPGTSLDSWVDRYGTGAFPVAAADYVDKFISPNSGRLINEFTWGGYLSWRLGPRYQTLLDGRTQLFDNSFWQATYMGTEEDQKIALTRAPADAAILPANNSKFAHVLRELGWNEAYADSTATVLIPPTHNALVKVPTE